MSDTINASFAGEVSQGFLLASNRYILKERRPAGRARPLSQPSTPVDQGCMTHCRKAALAGRLRKPGTLQSLNRVRRHLRSLRLLVVQEGPRLSAKRQREPWREVASDGKWPAEQLGSQTLSKLEHTRNLKQQRTPCQQCGGNGDDDDKQSSRSLLACSPNNTTGCRRDGW
eukprot:CAMPEP_0115282474 /NCGR_PEP_ID=MMETSP0270-20121206/59864_1 /TAXON_ID=71861 /ORGANISM="Scrippsiella trochoidea, Strain CCMP3099" /LENGTH=170 /DNA_ID=CAMNT_0002699327 /DNA_START=147 /DNA_END=657 /DNA_ORIENTATION=-